MESCGKYDICEITRVYVVSDVIVSNCDSFSITLVLNNRTHEPFNRSNVGEGNFALIFVIHN